MSGKGEGSSQKGSKSSRAKLSEEQALHIFKMKGKKSRYELADEFDVAEFRRNAADIAWETEVWIADNPDHMIHFNGGRFLGPHKKMEK